MANCGGRARRAGRAIAALSLCALVACATRPAWREGRFAHPELGGELGDLAALEAGWRLEPRSGAALAYRHVDGTLASWVRDCRSVEAGPRALSRALWIGLPEGEIAEERGLEVAGAPGWLALGRAREAARALRIASITRVTKRCEDSWLLVTPHSELAHREAFEQWWRGFRDTAGLE